MPKVTIAQRAGSRKIENVDKVVGDINNILGDGAARVIDYADMSIDDQYKSTYDTDILIMVHGGALTNALYLPTGATLIDVYPYSFPFSLHGLVILTYLNLLTVPKCIHVC